MDDRKLVLIVEDESCIREGLLEFLEEEGFRAISAPDGEAALALLRGTPEVPALILLDLMMPKKDGLAFRAEQELDARLSAIPIVLMSADDQLEYRQIRMGIRHHVKKPLNLDRLLETIRAAASPAHQPQP